MLKLDPKLVAAVENSRCREDLYAPLQTAVELEHSTIPPYLTAWYSLEPGLNDEIGDLIRTVVIEEMLHMTIAANVLVALGGSPAINTPDFVPDYPGGLPGGIGGADFTVHIAAFSMDVVRDTFMAIEEPEKTVPVDDLNGKTHQSTATYRTIGEFYNALKAKLAELPDSDFGHEERQVINVFAPGENFPISDSASATRAIDIIIEQGEGTGTNPWEAPGEPAHYYRFAEIYFGAKLIETNGRYSYGGRPIAFVAGDVLPMKPDPTADQFPEGSFGRLLSDAFTEGYSNVLNSLHEAFNGKPEKIQAAIGLMYQLRLQARRLMSTPLKDGETATGGPVYRYRN